MSIVAILSIVAGGSTVALTIWLAIQSARALKGRRRARLNAAWSHQMRRTFERQAAELAARNPT